MHRHRESVSMLQHRLLAAVAGLVTMAILFVLYTTVYPQIASSYNANPQLMNKAKLSEELAALVQQKLSSLKHSKPQPIQKENTNHFAAPRYVFTNLEGESIFSKSTFRYNPRMLKNLDLPLAHFADSDIDKASLLGKFAFATAASTENHDRFRDLVVKLQRNFNASNIFFCDIGIKKQRERITRTWCNIDFFQLNYTAVPSHVRNQKNRSYKPLCIVEALRRYDTIIWLDAEVRLATTDIWNILQTVASSASSPLALMMPEDGTVADFTDAEMFDYFLSDQRQLQTIPLYNASVMVVRNDPYLYDRVIHWWVLCALEEECIAPTWSNSTCAHRHPGDAAPAHTCHKLDWSALNVLLANHFQFNSSLYAFPDAARHAWREVGDLKRPGDAPTECHPLVM